MQISFFSPRRARITSACVPPLVLSVFGAFLAAPAAEASSVAVVYFSQYENVAPEALAALQKEHPERIDARSGASLAAPGLVGLVARWSAAALRTEPRPIVVRDPYDADYRVCLARVEEERETQARPPLAERTRAAAQAVREADRIVLAVPNWGYTLPAGVRRFLEENASSFAGKTVAPIVVHGTGGLAGTIDALRADLPGVRVLDALSLTREEVRGARETVEHYVERSVAGKSGPSAP